MAAPTVNLFVPPSTATRMAPHGLAARIDLGAIDMNIGSTSGNWQNASIPTGASDVTCTIGGNNDDADQVVGSTLTTANANVKLRHENSGPNRDGAFRFTAPSSLANSKYIVRAEFSGVSGAVDDTTLVGNIYGDDQTSSPDFSSADIDSRTRTTASSSFAATGTPGSALTFTGLAPIIQEIYDLGERDVYTLILEATGGNFDDLWIKAYDGASDVPTLDLWLSDSPIGSEYQLTDTLASLSDSGAAVSNVTVKENGSEMTEGTVGSLAAGEYGVSGGYLYVRLSDDSNPSSKAADYVQVSFDSSLSGDGSHFRECRVMWNLEADGGALANLSDRSRYVNDPRPGLDSKQIDLAGVTDTDNFNRPRGWNMGWWIDAAGTWRVVATVTNPSGDSTTETSSDITIAADSRTEYTVQSSGGDYTTLASALSARAATNDVKITIEDGHTENITAALTTITGSNFVVEQAGTGTRPVITRSSGQGSGSETLWAQNGENFVINGIVMADGTSAVASAGYTPTAFLPGANGAYVQCGIAGDATDRQANLISVSGAAEIDNLLILSCDANRAMRYPIYVGGGDGLKRNVSIVGCTLGLSEDESTIRIASTSNGINALWNDLAQDEVKSCLRFSACHWGHAYGNKWVDGDNWIGAAGIQDRDVENIRVEANWCEGTVSAPQLLGGINEAVNGLFCCNNVCLADGPNINIGNKQTADYGSGYQQNNSWLHNTYIPNSGNSNGFASGGTSVDESFFLNNRIAANIHAPTDGDDITGNYITIGDDAADIINNVLPSTISNVTNFASIYVATVQDRTAANLTALNAEAWASGNTQRDVTLDADYRDSSPTTVTTESGVFDDYYGNSRGATSYAGATIAAAAAGAILLDVSDCRRGMLTEDGNLKPGLVNSTYTTGDGDADNLKPSLLTAAGELKPGWKLRNGTRKPSNRAKQ